MSVSMTGAVLAAVGGVAVAAANARMTRMVLRRKPQALGMLFVLRQAIHIAFLAALYFLSEALSLDKIPLLVGGALGVTVPSILFAMRLARQEDAQKRQTDAPEYENQEGKEQ